MNAGSGRGTRDSAGMRIGYLNQDFPPEVGAGPARITEMATQWQAHGAVVTAITGMPNRRIPGRGEGGVDPRYAGRLAMVEDWEGIRTLRSWVYGTARQGFVWKTLNNASFMVSSFVHALARGERYDVLIASSPPFFPHVTGVALATLRRMPLVLEIRDLWPDYLVELGMLSGSSARALFALERALLRRADHVVVVTESFKDRVAEKGVSPDRITVIPNGVDLTRYAAGSPSVPRGDSFHVGYLGTFGRGQALAVVVEAAALVAPRDPSVTFTLVGDGPDRSAVMAAIERTGARNIEVKPPIPRDETRAFYQSCDACLVPLAPVAIFQQTIPSKIFEVMACERPVIAALSGEGERIVRSSGAGITSVPGDAASLANGILELRSRTATERSDMGRRGREFVRAHYDRAMLADKYFTLLQSIVSARGIPSLT